MGAMYRSPDYTEKAKRIAVLFPVAGSNLLQSVANLLFFSETCIF
jgi:hypothetical protein